MIFGILALTKCSVIEGHVISKWDFNIITSSDEVSFLELKISSPPISLNDSNNFRLYFQEQTLKGKERALNSLLFECVLDSLLSGI